MNDINRQLAKVLKQLTELFLILIIGIAIGIGGMSMLAVMVELDSCEARK